MPRIDPHRPCLMAVACFVWLAATGCGRDEAAPASAPPRVAVSEVAAQPVVVERRWSGLLEPLQTLIVSAPGPGVVTDLPVRAGDPVEAGTLLVVMVDPELEARQGVLKERAGILAAELAEWKSLADDGAAGPVEVNAARLALLSVEEQLAAAEALRSSYRIRSPVKGRVARVAVAEDSAVVEQQSLLDIEDDRVQGVRLLVPARELQYLAQLERLTLRDVQGGVLAIERIVHSGAGATGFAPVEIHVASDGPPARGELTLVYQVQYDAVTVPWTAVASDGDNHWVAVIEPDAGTIQRRPVQLGRAQLDGVEVREGLAVGERVVRYEPRAQPEGRVVVPWEGP